MLLAVPSNLGRADITTFKRVQLPPVNAGICGTIYNQMITAEMDQFARDNPSYTPKQARDFLESRVEDWGKMYVKSLEYVHDTSDPGTAKR